MSRVAFDDKAEPTAKGQDLGQYLPCSRCRGMTPKQALGDFGAMCFPCFQDYCRMGRAKVEFPLTFTEKSAILQSLRGLNFAKPDLEWATRLRHREQAGERLSAVQRAMSLAALSAVRHGVFAESDA